MVRYTLVTLVLTTSLFAKHPKISTDLENPGSEMVDVIVQYEGPPGQLDYEKMLGGDHMKLALHGINAAAFTVPASAVKSIANDPKVKYVSRDRQLLGMLDVTTAAVNASLVWPYGLVGTGIGVAVVDSGINVTADLNGQNSQNRVVYSEAFGGLPDTSDGFGHGTHVSGIIAANGKSSNGKFTGMAPNVNIINLRVLDNNGIGQDSTVIAAIQRAIDLKSRYNIRILNLSLGRPVFESYALDPLCQIVERAWKAGIFVVVAAGNSGRDNSQDTNGYATIQSPGNDPYVITVGAMKTMSTPDRSDDLVASYSSKGPTLLDHVVKPDIVAPGNFVASTLTNTSTLYGMSTANEIYKSYYTGNTKSTALSNTYYRLNGTSMAAPVISGAAALILQVSPALTPDQLKARLMKTATKNFPTSSVAVDPVTGITYVSQYDIFTIGAGYLDVARALLSTETSSPTLSAASPTVSYDPTSLNVYLVSDSSAVWGSTGVWSSGAVWGGNAVWGSNAVWGANAVWGSSTLQGFNAVWGANAVWGSGFTSAQALSTLLHGER